MHYEIDQSGKLENTAVKTVLAYSNCDRNALILSTRTKLSLQARFRRLGTPRLFVDKVFAICVFLLIKDKLPGGGRFVIDIEYPGHTGAIKKFIEDLSDQDICLEWRLIGKNSPAHDVAYRVYKGKEKIGRRLSTDEIWKLCCKLK